MKRKNNSTFRAYERLLRVDPDFDYGFLLKLEQKKMQRMAKYFSKADISYTDATKAKELLLCVCLLDIVLKEEELINQWVYDVFMHMPNKLLSLSNNDGIYNADCMTPDFPKYVNLRNALRFVSSISFTNDTYESEEDQKRKIEFFKKEVREAKAWHLYNLIREYKMLGWWN